jgi:hypothetical protein
MSIWRLALCVLVLVGCSSSESDLVGGTGAAGGAGGAGASGAAAGSGAGTGGSGAGGALPYGFRYGVNLGHRNASWGDADDATLASRAGVRSIRVKLPAMHLATWGYDIEVGDMQSYQSLGLHDHIGFLIGSESVDLTVAPPGSQDWQNEYYIPKNLYEPIVLGDGSVNPNNYWASYVYRTVDTYKSWVHVWHVWNEPDWVADWQVTQSWGTEPPAAADLPRFNGSIFDYVRMLRVTREAAHKADPAALIATGGIGYPTFLAAILRYTDNPTDGSVSADFPAKGGAYLDVIDFHYYPIFSPKSSDASVDQLIASKAAFAQVLADAGATVRGWNVSETGAPLATTPDYPTIGSPEYARNYLLKTMVTAQANDIGGVDWFILSNGEDASTDVFDHMGLYEDVAALSTVDQAVKTDAGTAYATLGDVLGGASYDAAATVALGLPAGVRGVCFAQDGKRRIALWAETPAANETAAANVELATSTGFDVHAWDGTISSADASGGMASLDLDGAPLLLVER